MGSCFSSINRCRRSTSLPRCDGSPFRPRWRGDFWPDWRWPGLERGAPDDLPDAVRHTDPGFSRDIGFYVFTLPGLAGLLGFLAGLVSISLLLLLPLYGLRGDIILSPRPVRFEPSAGMHLGILVAVLFLLTAVRLWFVDAPNLLYSTTGPLVGASYTDLHARLPAIWVTAVLAPLAAAIVLIGAMRRDLSRGGLRGVGGYVVVAVLGRGLFP